MDKLKMSPAELLKLVVIKPIEQECLDRVFKYLSNLLPISFTNLTILL
jgi:hypothetical protein